MAEVRDCQVDRREPNGEVVGCMLGPLNGLWRLKALVGVPSSAVMLLSVRHEDYTATLPSLTLKEANPVETLQNKFSGYGSTPHTVARTLDRLKLKEPLEQWSPETISSVVNAFTDEKFPTVFALNKIDHPDADKNISKIAKMQDPQSIILCSAISEVFLRKLAKQGYVKYVEGSEFVDTREDLIELGEADGGGLKELDEKLKTRIENLKDMVLYRFGSTGVVQVLSRAAELLGLVPVFPVKNIHGFGAGGGSNAVFRDCVLVKKGTTVKDCARKIMGDAPLAYVEGAGGVRVAEDEVVEKGKNDVSWSMPLNQRTTKALCRYYHSRLVDSTGALWNTDNGPHFAVSSMQLAIPTPLKCKHSQLHHLGRPATHGSLFMSHLFTWSIHITPNRLR